MGDFLTRIGSQFEELKKNQPLLILNISEDVAVISGPFCIHKIFQGNEYCDSFEIEAAFTNDFPSVLPVIKEMGGKIKAWFEHICADRQLCLEIDTKMIMELDESPTLEFFFEHYVLPYFLGYLCYKKERRFPFGERSHKEAGVLEFYCELFGVNDMDAARILLSYVCGTAPKGHNPCPCQSGQKYRDCHRDRVNELKEGKFANLFVLDYRYINGGD